MELHDENNFKIRGYQNAIFQLDKSDVDLASLNLQELEQLDGVGKGIAGTINQISLNGISEAMEQYLENTPEGIIELLDIKGIGPKKIKVLWKELGIESGHELKEAANAGLVSKLKGFGDKTQQVIIEALEFKEANANKLHYADAEGIAQEVLDKLSSISAIQKSSTTGGLRRNLEVIDKIEILLAGDDFDDMETAICELPDFEQDLRASGPITWRGSYLEHRVPCEFTFCDPESFVKDLFLRTGSDLHLSVPVFEKQTLKDLANRASSLGAERFVLDDGWFIGRDDDTAGLGDWYVDKKYYPQGLTPLIDHVTSQGLEFGLWFEPEMVNPDSDLFRAHPDWVLGTPPNPQVGFRHQLVLDLSRQAVFDYLFERIDSLLTEYNISYIKWDMNRDINHPGDANGKPAIHKQTLAFYRLVAKLKLAHPTVEIESCASGGGRADYGVLAHTDRIWTSDSNDSLERLKIQKGFSYFFPSELMGSHVGPRDCHITHRNINMAMRASVVLFGHMGMEMDLRELTDTETTELKAMVALYKKHRHLVHSGELFRLELPQYMHGLGIVAEDKSEALFSYSLIACSSASLPDQFHFAGLEKQALYQLDIIWPIKSGDRWPKASVFNFKTHLPDVDGKQFSGEVLMQLGMQLPLLTPQSSLIFHLSKVG